MAFPQNPCFKGEMSIFDVNNAIGAGDDAIQVDASPPEKSKESAEATAVETPAAAMVVPTVLRPMPGYLVTPDQEGKRRRTAGAATNAGLVRRGSFITQLDGWGR